jgi:hypothetical protein
VTQTQNHTGTRSRIRALRPLAGALATLFCASACASGATSTASNGSSTPAPGTAAVNRSTPGAVLTHWLQQVVRGDYGRACQDMRRASSSTAASAPYSAAACAARSSDSGSVLTHLHGNFTVDGITPRSSITVATAHVTGTSATVGGTDIYVSGTTLTSLIVAHSTGVKPGQFSISFKLSRIRGAWYVTGMNMGF